LDSLVARRCVRSFAGDPIPLEVLASILVESTRLLRAAEHSKVDGDPVSLLNSYFAWLQIYIVVQGVDQITRGVYQYDPLGNHLRWVGPARSDDEIAVCVHGQTWIGGGGFCLFAAAQWDRYMWVYRHARAYMNLLVQVGEFGQEVLFPACRLGLGAWMTPAIYESAAARLLALEPLAEDAVFFLKIGPPKPSDKPGL
jgi:SagB-type dehydrogenase family enzyme